MGCMGMIITLGVMSQLLMYWHTKTRKTRDKQPNILRIALLKIHYHTKGFTRVRFKVCKQE